MGDRIRRGRGFNPIEVANLRSWGVEPRPDEIDDNRPFTLLPAGDRSELHMAQVRAGLAGTLEDTPLSRALSRGLQNDADVWLRTARAAVKAADRDRERSR